MVKINSAAPNLGEIINVYINNAFFWQKPIILCIGSDRATGDCLAPLVGTLLKEELDAQTHVYGTLEHPVNATNVAHVYNEIRRLHPHRKILCIDACFGKLEEVGFFKLTTGGLLPGAAAQKNLGRYGDHSILAIVDEKSENCYSIFKTRMKQVFDMSRVLARAIANAVV